MKKMKIRNNAVLRYEFIQSIIDEWARGVGVEKIRNDPAHELVGATAAEGSEENIEWLHEPLSMLLAQFGLKQPSILKIRVNCWLIH